MPSGELYGLQPLPREGSKSLDHSELPVLFSTSRLSLLVLDPIGRPTSRNGAGRGSGS